MGIEHLTDSEIQNMLDGNRLPNQAAILSHLESCKDCQGSLKQYQMLYVELKHPEPVALRPDFAARMADQFEIAYARSRNSNLVERFLWSGIGIAAAIAVYFFVDLSSVTHAFEGFGLWDSFFSADQLAAWTNILKEYSVDPTVVAMAAVALILFGNMDSIIRHFRDRTPMCM